jgi:predicted transcriptional regulator YheO
MVCAPSNAAIDQIIMRIIEKGLIGMIGIKRTKKVSKKEENKHSDSSSSEDEENSNQDLSQTLIRITSAEYHTESDIKKYTLENRIIKKLCIEKFGELKKAIKQLKEFIDEMNDYDAWDDN